MTGTRVQILKGQAALDELMYRYKLPDWQAKKVLGTARQYGLNNIPVDGGYSTLSVEYKDRHFHIGGYRRGKRHPGHISKEAHAL